ncbi:hypothetical protein HOLleu_38333 [Holothuria leucospilota]|uniref:Proline-rich transmembrane protein 3/4 domain-containing protein n=1 Tax=Holothuria leucospilota TaxID=206669 RepID=A0A9Q0YE57_HOLLE|nr:hypothetical protein HOLleu_38333 [Holothuria leucospilota]
MDVTVSDMSDEGAALDSVGIGDPSDDSMTSDMLAPRNNAPPWPWLLLWSLHYYILGAVFLALACYALYSLLDSCRRPPSGVKRVTSISSCILAIKVLLFILGLTRALYMYLYLQFWYDTGKPWKVVENILSNVAYPCLTAGFGLMCQILFEASRLKARSSSKVLASKVLLIIVIACHFVIVITVVILIEFMKNFVLMLLLCHGTFIVWGIFLIVTFLVFSKKLAQAEKKSSCVLAEIKEKESSNYGASCSASTNYSNISNSSTPQQNRANIGRSEGAPQNTVDEVFEDAESSLDNNSVCNGQGGSLPIEDKIRIDDKAVLNQNTVSDLDGKAVKNSERDKTSCHNRISSMLKWTKNGLKSELKEKVYSRKIPMEHSPNEKPSPVTKMVCSRNTDNSKQGPPRSSYRVKLTRKVMRIANLTAFLSALCVVLNTFATLRGLAYFYYQWKMTQTAVYVVNTFFRDT